MELQNPTLSFVEKLPYGVTAFSMADIVFVESFTYHITLSNVVLFRQVDCLEAYLPVQI